MRLRAPRLLAVVLTATLALAVGCSGAAGGGSGSSGKPTINVLLIDQPTTKDMQATAIPAFEKRTGITVNVEVVPESGMDAKLALALSGSSDQYDVVMTGAKNTSTLVASNWLKPLDGYIGDSTKTPADYIGGFPATLLRNIKVNGKSYGMPFQVGADMLFYNKEMFTAAGLDPANPPHTMTEIVQAAKKLNKPDRSQAGFVGRGTREGNENSFAWIMMWFLNGGRWANVSGQPQYDVLDQPAALTTTQQYQELLKSYGPAGASNYGFAQAQLAMQQGKAAMWLDAAQLGPALEDPSASKIAGKVGYASLKGQGEGYIVGAVWSLSMAAGTKNPDADWDLIKDLTGKDVSVAQAGSGVNGSPARTDALQDPTVKQKLNPEFVKALTESIAHTNPLYTPLTADGTQIRGALSLELSNVLSGQSDPQAAMASANAAVKKIVAGG